MWTSELFNFKENILKPLSYLTPLTRLRRSLSWFNPLRRELWQKKRGNTTLCCTSSQLKQLLFFRIKRILLHQQIIECWSCGTKPYCLLSVSYRCKIKDIFVFQPTLLVDWQEWHGCCWRVWWGGNQSRQTQTNQNLPLFPGGLLDEHDQELRMTAQTTMMINETCC